MGRVIGIDLGTTYSAVAYVNDHGKPELLPNSDSERITPSVILFDDEAILVGRPAKQQTVAEADRIVAFVKRHMGKSVGEYSRTFRGKRYSADELSAIILKKLSQDANDRLHESVTDVVITVPAYFGDAQRAATRNAGRIAGLNVLQIVNEPTAAALAYGIDRLGRDMKVFVFDLGGGTFDVTLMEIQGSTLRMINTEGDHRLGGKDWDDAITLHVAKRFQEEHGSDPLSNLPDAQDLQLRATEAKETLSRREKAKVVCTHDGKSLTVTVTRTEFEGLTQSLVDRCKDLCERALRTAQLGWDALDTILLVGGSTRMPMIRDMLATLSRKSIDPTELNPDEAVALGAALQGTLRQISERTDDAPPLAAAISREYGTADVQIVDGATHNLGVIVRTRGASGRVDHVNHIMIKKMEPVPCAKKDENFSVPEDNLASLAVRVVQGLPEGVSEASGISFDDKVIGTLDVKLPPGTPAGAPVGLTYKYNLDQTLDVEATGPDGRVFKTTIKRGTLDDGAVATATADLQRLDVE